jgi:thymidylate synthase
MNNLDPQYINLVKDILDNGYSKGDRTGTGTKSVFGRQIRHKMSDGFPLLTTKKMPFKTIVTELLWFLRGDTNIKYLVDNNCHIWDGDAYKNYLKNCTKNYTTHNEKVNETDIPIHWKGSVKLDLSELLTQEEFINKIKTDDEFAKKWGELGPIYGKQWRNIFKIKDGDIEGHKILSSIDQIQNLINDLKTNPDSRRLMVNAWNVGELDSMVLPPCHYGFQVYTRELDLDEKMDLTIKKYGYIPGDGIINIPERAISLIWNQRSVDTGLGLAFNIASYAILLQLIGRIVNMVPDELIGNLGDTHLYNNHIEPIKEQLTREGFQLPILKISDLVDIDIKKYLNKENIDLDMFISRLKVEDFQLEGYESHPTIKLPLSN